MENRYINTMSDKAPSKFNTRVLVFTPTTGLVRIEWVMARYGQIIPTNWSSVDNIQPVPSYIATDYSVPDAQNLAARNLVGMGFEWLLSIESDNILPPDAFLRINEYMRNKEIPVVGGLYFTKGSWPEPMIYRGRGNSYFKDWKMGDKVWCDGLPMGFTLIHASLIKAVWDESPEYVLYGQTTRRVFETPENIYIDPEKNNGVNISVGTSDLTFFSRVIEGNYLEKAGWPKLAKKKYPFLVDTNIFVKHIDNDGVQWPLRIPDQFIPDEKTKVSEVT